MGSIRDPVVGSYKGRWLEENSVQGVPRKKDRKTDTERGERERERGGRQRETKGQRSSWPRIVEMQELRTPHSKAGTKRTGDWGSAKWRSNIKKKCTTSLQLQKNEQLRCFLKAQSPRMSTMHEPKEVQRSMGRLFDHRCQ